MTSRNPLTIGIAISILLTGLIWLGGSIPASVTKIPDQGALWYYWQLPEATFWGRVTVWGMYLAHQLSIWACIWRATQTKLKYTTTLHPINKLMLVINGVFILLHFLQTYIWYQPLAQDTSILSSLGAVALMLVFVLILETPRRGLFFGEQITFRKEFLQIIKKYHGYFFSFAAIYTFWYHPMEATPGHLFGFFYLFLLLFQSSLIFNRAHLNRWWTFTLEIMVLFHSVAISWMQGRGNWPSFLFGFAGILIITQMHGLPIRPWVKRTIYGGFLLSVFTVYGLMERGFDQVFEIIKIPMIDYVAIAVIYLIFMLGFWTISWFYPNKFS